jgi:hypothetical protein
LRAHFACQLACDVLSSFLPSLHARCLHSHGAARPLVAQRTIRHA